MQKKKNLIVQIGCHIRFHPLLIKIKEWINYYLKKNDYVLDYKILDILIENYSDDLSNIFCDISKSFQSLFNNSLIDSTRSFPSLSSNIIPISFNSFFSKFFSYSSSNISSGCLSSCSASKRSCLLSIFLAIFFSTKN